MKPEDLVLFYHYYYYYYYYYNIIVVVVVAIVYMNIISIGNPSTCNFKVFI